jgi:hypothetical protein
LFQTLPAIHSRHIDVDKNMIRKQRSALQVSDGIFGSAERDQLNRGINGVNSVFENFHIFGIVINVKYRHYQFSFEERK